ncbi:MAG: phosphoglycerate mutase [Steroidobacteraceae bacterium]|nr:phosphoglycerate mutase [Steroidobacteraceae bacterium]
MQLYLIRHPEPIGVDGRCYGRTDMRVEEAAIARALPSIAASLSARTLADAEIHCSPLTRCMGLARRIAAPREPIVDEDLVEIDFGAWEGLPWDEVPRDAIDAWTRDIWGYRPGGGESAAMVASRWHRWLTRVQHGTAQTVIAVTHAGVIRVALSPTAPSGEAVPIATPIPFGAVYRLQIA